jgi:hypothetical protein
MTEALADRIIEYRTITPFKQPAELGHVAGMQQIATTLLTTISTKGSVYRITSEGVVHGTVRSIQTVVRMTGNSTPSILYWREF